MAMLVSLTSFAAALGDGYEKVTDISTLAAGDKVVLYCDDSNIGVTGVNGTKDAAVAATGWVEYLVEAATGGVKLKDTNANKYVSLTTKNTFTYAASGSVCKVNAKGVLAITLSGTDYFLYNNGGNYYRMYTDKTGNASYKPFYVYKILAAGEVKAPVINAEVEFETSTTVSIEVSEGLKAYYTLDGTEPTTASTEYTAPFEVTETTTVTAVAYDEAADKLSEVSTVTLTKLQVLTCAEAAALCTSTASADKYIIKGYVTSIVAAYDASYNNVSFWMADTENGGNVIQAFRVYPTTEADKAVKVGDYVVVVGKLKLYNSTPEIENGTFTITEAPAPEPVMFTVTATAENGTVTGAGEYEENAEATLTATANEGYEFTCWTSGEDTVSTANPYTFVVTADVALVANFNKKAEPTTETIYFINAKNWAKVNVYAWTTDPNAAWPGAAATKEAEQIAGYDVYSFTANAGQYANVIFNNGSSQTPDLVWTAGKYYVIDMGWLTKEEAESKLAAPLPETWNIVGDAGLMGKGWDLNAAENAMTKQADGTYLLEKKDITITAGSYEYKAAKDHGYTVAVPQDGNQKLTISKSGIYDITFVLNVTAKTLKATATLKKEAVVIPTVVIAGDMNSWNQTKDKFTMSADSLTATFKATLAVKNYGFKMIVGGAWHSDGKAITRAANSTKFTGANSSTNSTLKADIAGEYLFTWEYATKTLTVTYPALPVKYNVNVTAENGTVTGAGEYEEGKTATLTATPAEGYQFVNWTVGDSIVSTENPYKFTVTADLALVANFELIPPTKYNVTVTAENGTVEGAGEYEENAEATLTATAAEGYEFVNWTVGDSIVSTENPYKFTVTADLALVANFKVAVTTITETFDLTTEDALNRMGTYNVYAGDYILRIYGYMGAGTYQDDPATEEVVEVQLFTPDYEEPINAVVVVTIDEENNKEVMQVTATSADGKKIYNLTFNIVAPEIQEHVLYITYPTITVEESPMGGVMYIIEEAEAMMDTEDNIVTVGMTILPSMNYAEMSIGDDIYATGEALVSEPFMGEFTIEAILTDDAGNTYNVTVLAQEIKQDIEIVVADTVELNGYNMTFEMQGNMAIVTANVNGIELFFWMTMYSDDNGYGTYFNDAITNVWYGENALTPYGDEHVYSAENLKVSFINDPDAEGNVTLYNFTLYAGDQPTGVDNINTTIAPVKVIENGQIFIISNGVKYNAQGAQL